MSDDLDFNIDDIEQRISKYFASEAVQSLIQDATKKNLSRVTIDINRMRESDPSLVKGGKIAFKFTRNVRYTFSITKRIDR